jgi:hypothetical protein
LVPRSQLDALAGNGFYGIDAPVAEGGVGPEDGSGDGDTDSFAVMCDVVAALAGGCLATTFVWPQAPRAGDVRRGEPDPGDPEVVAGGAGQR